MHAVAVEKSNAAVNGSGATKVGKKKNKNQRKNQNQSKSSEAVVPVEKNHDTKIVKSLNGPKNGAELMRENGEESSKDPGEKLAGECPEIKQNGCAESEHNHAVENGETTELVGSKKTRSRNQRKKRQKYGRTCTENGIDKIDKEEPSSVCSGSDKIISSNNNTIEKSAADDKAAAVTNGSSNWHARSTKSKNVKQHISEPSPSTPSESKIQIKSLPTLSSPSPASSSSQSSSSPSSQSPPPSTKQKATLSPIPSTSRTQPPPPTSSSSSSEQISNKPESQGLELEKKKEESGPASVPTTAQDQPSAGPSEEEGAVGGIDLSNVVIEYKQYESELQMQDIMRLIQSELSEPYSIYTYRYFIYNWPKLCFLAAHGDEYVGAIVCKLDMHMNVKRGYIAMLAVKKEYRKMKIGTTLVEKAIEVMLEDGADEVVLETEMKNTPALRLYENLGFVRDKRLFRYYLNGVDALRLKLWFR